MPNAIRSLLSRPHRLSALCPQVHHQHQPRGRLVPLLLSRSHARHLSDWVCHLHAHYVHQNQLESGRKGLQIRLVNSSRPKPVSRWDQVKILRLRAENMIAVMKKEGLRTEGDLQGARREWSKLEQPEPLLPTGSLVTKTMTQEMRTLSHAVAGECATPHLPVSNRRLHRRLHLNKPRRVMQGGPRFQ